MHNVLLVIMNNECLYTRRRDLEGGTFREEKKKQRPGKNTMRIDQVSKHEETSFLLDAETNQAILKNAIARDELCRYLTPLKFIEIDTWRREVPYGLSKDSHGKRRWKTPLEVLLATPLHSELQYIQALVNGKAEGHSERPQTETRDDLFARRQGLLSAPVKSALVSVRSPALNARVKDDVRNSTAGGERAKQNPATSYSRPTSNLIAPRPATSPFNDAGFVRSGRQKPNRSRLDSAQLPSKQMPSTSSDGVKLGHRPEGASFVRSSRSPVSSVASLRRSRQSSQSTNTHINSAREFNENRRESDERVPVVTSADSHLHRRAAPSDTSSPSATQDVTRPRTRSNQHGGETVVPLNVNPTICDNWNAVTSRPSTGTQHGRNSGASGRLQGAYSDPNIAYGPLQSAMRSKRESLNPKVRNYYFAAQQSAFSYHKMATQSPARTVPSKADRISRSVACVLDKSENKTLRSDTEVLSRHSQPTISVTPRIVYQRPDVRSVAGAIAVTKYQPKHSPWVVEALPDPTSDRIARAEKDGYYVSKRHGKSVSFQLREPLSNDSHQIDHSGPTQSGGTQDSNLPTVVLNVERDSARLQTTGNVIAARRFSPRGYCGQDGFASGSCQTIPVQL